MKKLFYFLLALPLVTLLASCSDDDDKFPDVNITASFDGGTQVDDVYYVVQGNNFEVTQVTLQNNGTADAVIGGVRYFWDYMPIGTTVTQPYALTINTETIPVGNHLLTAEIPVYAVGYSITTGLIAKKVKIVAEESDIPSVTIPGDPTTQADIRVTDQ